MARAEFAFLVTIVMREDRPYGSRRPDPGERCDQGANGAAVDGSFLVCIRRVPAAWAGPALTLIEPDVEHLPRRQTAGALQIRDRVALSSRGARTWSEGRIARRLRDSEGSESRPSKLNKYKRFRDLAEEIGANVSKEALEESVRFLAKHAPEPRRKGKAK